MLFVIHLFKGRIVSIPTSDINTSDLSCLRFQRTKTDDETYCCDGLSPLVRIRMHCVTKQTKDGEQDYLATQSLNIKCISSFI